MNTITYYEQQMIAIFHAGTRAATISVLEEIQSQLEHDEASLQELTLSTIQKLMTMSDEEYGEMELIPDFGEGFDGR